MLWPPPQACPTLCTLVLSRCAISDKLAIQLSQLFVGTAGRALTSVDLSQNQISSQGAKAIAGVIDRSAPTKGGRKSPKSRNGRLRHLDLSWNALTAAGAEAIAKAVRACTLESISLEFADLQRGSALEFLAASLERNTSLRRLNVAHNGISPQRTLLLA